MIFIYSSCLHYNDHSAPKIVRKNLKKGEIITSKKVFKHYNLPTYDDYRFSSPGDYILWNTGGVILLLSFSYSFIEGLYVLNSLKYKVFGTI